MGMTAVDGALLVISVLVFAYLLYALINPEKF
jgi:K+-transporting ATPase KdpF subunit